jgi:alpha-glucan,water dikinase
VAGEYFQQDMAVADGHRIKICVREKDGKLTIQLDTGLTGRLVLHWGVCTNRRKEWTIPPKAMLPENTEIAKNTAARTPFTEQGGINILTFDVNAADSPHGIVFVLNHLDSGKWIKDSGGNFYIPLGEFFGSRNAAEQTAAARNALGAQSDLLGPLADEIIQAECGDHSWTLMHRFKLCHDLCRRHSGNRDALTLIFTWMRFSTLRQLDWQRNYNTQPRELSHAQDRLTLALAEIYAKSPDARPILRLILACVGPGGDGQRIRDEILQIMHRHRIKEVTGHFLEEWHQKLHNNATPDDVVICRAYIEFLKSGGNHDVFYSTLAQGGVLKERMENYERPIRTRPDFVPHLKDALIHDFGGYLKVLTSVHSATDLENFKNSAWHLLDDDLRGPLHFIVEHRERHDTPIKDLAGAVTHVRAGLKGRLASNGNTHEVRTLLYLDLSLEEFFRTSVERVLARHMELDTLTMLIGAAGQNIALTEDSAELSACLSHWRRICLITGDGRNTQWARKALSAVERMRRVLGGFIDARYEALQPKARFLGDAFGASAWSVELFTEEVVRGRPEFILSALLRHADPTLRSLAGVSGWQILSPGEGEGAVAVFKELSEAEGADFGSPVVVAAEKINGTEELPDAVKAVVTPDLTDILSHVSVRARNSRMLFAICYDREIFDRLKSLAGRCVRLSSTSAGDVIIDETGDETGIAGGSQARTADGSEPGDGKRGAIGGQGREDGDENRPADVLKGRAASVSSQKAAAETVLAPRRRSFTSYAVSFDEFNDTLVGAKSNNLKILRGRLPEWIHMPRSAAVPFGVMERALLENPDAFVRVKELIGRLGRQGQNGQNGQSGQPGQPRQNGQSGQSVLPGLPLIDPCAQDVTAELRACIMTLSPPEGFFNALQSAMTRSGLTPPPDTDSAWQRIKTVWASVWNRRACLSRARTGFPHENVSMAVLVQEVVPARYAFVIHTVNPFKTSNTDEIYAEVVPGLGETLVGNHPGRALGFSCPKGSGNFAIASYPGKSIGLYGSGLIFRSDSSAEDLHGYAGAGLYDSVLLEPPREVVLDYSDEPLVWDEDFQRRILGQIAELAAVVEQAAGCPQDIEGAYHDGRFYVVQSRPQTGL